ncbi:hypothetical protein X743_03780 [Mesorhizobium sp. LNHC252B00]|nr:hypothetical protein X743_03780 [Mesorhizobium sp. LNHC252B00]
MAAPAMAMLPLAIVVGDGVFGRGVVFDLQPDKDMAQPANLGSHAEGA